MTRTIIDQRDRRTIVFFPEGAFGPTNNCVGIGDVLRRRGHRVVFIVEESFAGTLAAKGFEERLMRLGPPPLEPERPGQFWKDFVADTAPVFRTDTVAQVAGFMQPTWEALIDGARYVDDLLTELIAELEPDVIVEDNVCAFPAIPASGRPWVRIMSCNPLELRDPALDVIVEDNVCAFPAIPASGRPWVRIMSCNPLELRDPALPPPYSGLPSDDPSGWDAFHDEYESRVGPLQHGFSEFCVQRGAPPLPDGEMIHESPWLNLSLYPEELDYARRRSHAPTWHNLQSSVRDTDEPWSPPGRDGRALVYLSLGSLGSADVALMRELVTILADTPHRYIVSRGPRHDEYSLADNMTGAEFLPQTRVLPHVDAVITHGGNNTVTESMWCGTPMVVLPIFWDQHDNAQRVHERGYGIRLPTYDLTAKLLTGAVDRVLSDQTLRARVAAAGRRLRQRPGTALGADLIARVACTGEPVLRQARE